MERALVVVDDSDAHRELLSQRAGQLARRRRGRTGTVLLGHARGVREGRGDDGGPRDGRARLLQRGRRARRRAKLRADGGRRRLRGRRATVRRHGCRRRGRGTGRRILDAASREDCDHVFVVGRRRSPTERSSSATWPSELSSTSTARSRSSWGDARPKGRRERAPKASLAVANRPRRTGRSPDTGSGSRCR